MTKTQMKATLTGLSMAQRGVYHVLKSYGPMPDTMLVVLYPEAIKLIDRGTRYPAQTPSGLRTRRHELVLRGAVVADRKVNGKRIWRAL